MVDYFPPDYKSQIEWGLWVQLGTALLGIRGGWGFAMLILIILALISVVLIKLTIAAMKRLYEIYRTRSTANGRNAKVLRYAGTGLIIVWAVAITTALDPRHFAEGFTLFTGALFVFTLISEVVDWLESRKEPSDPAELSEHLSLHDVISWKNEVDQAQSA